MLVSIWVQVWIIAVENELSRLLRSSILEQAVTSVAISICWLRDCPPRRKGHAVKTPSLLASRQETALAAPFNTVCLLFTTFFFVNTVTNLKLFRLVHRTLLRILDYETPTKKCDHTRETIILWHFHGIHPIVVKTNLAAGHPCRQLLTE